MLSTQIIDMSQNVMSCCWNYVKSCCWSCVSCCYSLKKKCYGYLKLSCLTNYCWNYYGVN